MNKTSKRKYLVIVCLLIVALVTTIVLAETTTHTYSACLSRGVLFNVAIDANPPAPCKLGDLITWNQQGPAGPAGAQGPAGPQEHRDRQVFLVMR